MAWTELLVIRHGQTQWNLEGRAQGHQNSPLTPEGVDQAACIARRLASLDVDALYGSDLGRAVQTADAIVERTGLELRIDLRLREQNLGVFEGLNAEQRQRRHPQALAEWNRKDPDLPVPEGESMRERYDLAVACLEQIAEAHGGERVAVVTHGGVLNYALRRCMGLSLGGPRPFAILNASLNVFRIEKDRWKLVCWGDVAHLAGDVEGEFAEADTPA